MRIHDVLQKRAMAGRLFHLLEAHILADVLGDETNAPEDAPQPATTVKPIDTKAERATRDARSRRIAYEGSALRAELRNLSSNCAPS